MNLLLLAGFALGGVGLLWIAQTFALWASGSRTIWVLPYRHDSDSPRVRWAMKLALQAALLTTLFLYPWAIGQNPWQYHWERLTPIEWRLIPLGVCVTAGLLSTALLINVALGWVHI